MLILITLQLERKQFEIVKRDRSAERKSERARERKREREKEERMEKKGTIA